MEGLQYASAARIYIFSCYHQSLALEHVVIVDWGGFVLDNQLVNILGGEYLDGGFKLDAASQGGHLINQPLTALYM